MTPRLPLVLVVAPLLTLLSLAFSVFSGHDAGRLVYARVWGGPPAGALAVSIQVLEEESGLVRGIPELSITALARTRAGSSVRELRTDAEGWVEAVLPLPVVSEPTELEVRPSGRVSLPLARGNAAWSRAEWLTHGSRGAGVEIPGSDPRLPVGLHFEPPVLSVPFAGDVVLELASSAQAALEIRVEAEGARLLSSPVLLLVPGRAERVRLVPEAHTATLGISTQSASGQLRRTVRLPIRPGSLTAEVVGDTLIIASPVPRSRAHYSVVTPEGRLGGGVVSLGPRPDGTSAGSLARGGLPPGVDRYLVLSTSADGRAPALVGLPLDGQAGTFDARAQLLLDGRPGAVRASAAKRARLRFALLGYAAFGAGLSLVLFVWHIRRANERLRVELAEVGGPAEARDRSWFGPASAILSLLFAFGLALTWILVR